MKLYALCTLHEVSSIVLITTLFCSNFHPFQTGWGTRAGIGDAAAATAALDRQAEEKSNHINNPYQPQSHLEQPPHSGDSTASSFKMSNDVPPSPYRDEPAQTPIYHYRKTSQHSSRNRSVSSRRRPTDDVELQNATPR